jgi:glycosyltransferase involved in cell wall biosynthesis
MHVNVNLNHKPSKMRKTLIIIIARNGSNNLDQFLSYFFKMDKDPDAEIVVIDHGSSYKVRKVVDKFLTKGFIRYIKCRQDILRSKVQEIALRKRSSEKAIYLDVNPSGFIWRFDFSTKGLREDIAQIKERLEAYIKGYAQDDHAHPNMSKPSTEHNILFVLPDGIDSKHGYQVDILSRMLASQGATCTIAVPELSDEQRAASSEPSSLMAHGSSLITSHNSLHTDHASRLTSYDAIHAWTPREIVREFTEKLLARHNCPLIIHLEDNEEYLTEKTMGKPWAELAKMPEARLDKLIPKNRYHPTRGRKFLDKALGLSMVIDTLNRFNTRNVPYQVIPPMVDERLFYPRPINRDLRKKHNIPDDTTVLVYTGNVHAGNKDEVYELYKAVDLLNQQGHSTILLRTGQNNKDIGVKSWPGKNVIHLGWVERKELPDILAAADIFIQPGVSGPFNDERIPCKLPEYFAMGRPVVLPKTNLGLKVEHGVEGYVVDRGDAEGIVGAVKAILGNKNIREMLGNAAVDFYLYSHSTSFYDLKTNN